MNLKKYAIIYMLLISFGAVLFQQGGYVKAIEQEGPVVIPDDAIRLRILANSNSDEDQALKRLIRDEVNAEITEWVSELTSIEKARTMIENRVPELEEIVAQVLEREGMNQSFSIDFERSVSFPTKMYGNYIYPAGEYEAILISLGEAKGANWWCVLFPPLCFLDFSTGQAVKAESYPTDGDQGQEEVEVKSFVAEVVKKMTKKNE